MLCGIWVGIRAAALRWLAEAGWVPGRSRTGCVVAPRRQLEITRNGSISLCCLVIEETDQPCLSTDLMRPASLEYSRGESQFYRAWKRLPCGVWRYPLNRTRVLLADDHSVVLDRVGVLLSSSFEIVGAVTNGQELISAGIRLDPDVIVADVTMPVVGGIEAAHQLREAGSRAKFVFLTIHIEHEFVDACVAEGALGYVVKSHMKTDLIPAIRAALVGRTFVSPLVSR